jgi:hypothetical protein
MDRREFTELTGAAVAGMLVPSSTTAAPQPQPAAPPAIRPRELAMREIKRLAALPPEARVKAATDVRARRYADLLNLLEAKKSAAAGDSRPTKEYRVR